MSRLAPAVRVLLALLLSLLVVVESAGLARAMGLGSTVSCCCGRHAIARPCTCLRCPSKLRRAEAHQDHARAAVTPVGHCTPQSEDGALLVIATEVVAPTLAPPRLFASLAFPVASDPLSARPETARPPP